MKGLYDIHCHILPGVDDGARNMEESLWMLNKEYQEGVRHVILTPHFRYDMFEPHMNIVTRQFMQLRRAAMNIGDEGMRLYLGCELHSSMDMVECLKKGFGGLPLQVPDMCLWNSATEMRKIILKNGSEVF
ncbi:MAG: CpsB/CapC family capsule biosynthesis tyrosine phosphatase [Blautia wexlerae]